MAIKSFTATHKLTGKKFEYAVKLSWNTKYYTCEMNPDIPDSCAPWFTSLSAAFKAAIDGQYLVAA